MELNITFQQLGIAEEMRNPKVQQILAAVRDHSMVHETGILFTIASVVYVLKHGIPGLFIECGTWKGGCSVAMLLAQRELFGAVQRPVVMMDSFEGLPTVTPQDGPLAAQWQAGADQEKFFDNCRAAQAELQTLLDYHGFAPSDYRLIHGWFDQTAPALALELAEQPIGILRLDGDWYDSTAVTLRHLCPAVSEQGIVIVDDYYAWDGCARAVHEYLVHNDLPYRIKSLPYNFGAYFVKRRNRTSFDEF
jgi:hypothetical protein